MFLVRDPGNKKKTSQNNSSHFVIEKQVDKTFPYMYIYSKAYVYVCSSLIKINEPRRLIFPLFKAFCTHQQQSITLLLLPHNDTCGILCPYTTFLVFIKREIGRRRKNRSSNELINTLYTTHHYVKLFLCVGGGDGNQWLCHMPVASDIFVKPKANAQIGNHVT